MVQTKPAQLRFLQPVRSAYAGTFDTEESYDSRTINGQRYSGSTGPNAVAVSAGSTFTWRTDSNSSVQNEGWTVCLTQLRGVLRRVEEWDQVIALKQDEVVLWQSAFQIHEDEVVMTGKIDEGAFGEA